MASKILTLRLPRTTYDALASGAAVAGLTVSDYVRGKIDRAEIASIIEALTAEVQQVAAKTAAPPAPTREREILLLLRTLAAHINPQIPQAVAAKLRAEAAGGKK